MRISDWSSDVCSSDLDDFFAAGAPWFFTLFGRDSLWAARLVLPVDPAIAASTLRVLARLQGTVDDPATAQEPGKILHELRSSAIELPGEGIVLPPRYYGRSEEHTSELQSLMRISYAVFCLKK